jgi:hypothetical protein
MNTSRLPINITALPVDSLFEAQVEAQEEAQVEAQEERPRLG